MSEQDRSVLVMLTNYARPQNMPTVIEAWRRQTAPITHLVVVDNSAANPLRGTSEPYPRPWFAETDDVWRMTHNHGCPCHYAPALQYFDVKYILFSDDDVIPGCQALEHLLDTAALVKDKFATLGEVGRDFVELRDGGFQYRYGNVLRGVKPIQCNLTCRASMVQAKHLPFVLTFRRALIDAVGLKAATPLVGMHDDMLTCLGIQACTGWPTLLSPLTHDDEDKLVLGNLNHADHHSVYRRPQHMEERNAFLKAAVAVGWKPVKDVTFND